MGHSRSQQYRARRRATLSFALSGVLLLVVMFITGGRRSRGGDIKTDRIIIGVTIVATVVLIGALVWWLTHVDRRIRERYGNAAVYAGLASRFYTDSEKARLRSFRQRQLLDMRDGGCAYGTILIRADGVQWLPGPTARFLHLPGALWRWTDVRSAELGTNGLNKMMWLTLHTSSGEAVRLSVHRGDDARAALQQVAPSVFDPNASGWIFTPTL